MELTAGDGLLACLVGTFLTEAPDRVAAIAAADEAGDAAGLATAAHGLRGAAANLGAVHLARSAKRLEDAADRGAVPVGEDELDRLVHELDRARPALRAAVGQA